ncbi:MAG: CoA transferase [Actinobacteria bacterium]|nr:CoA transferase [Actinomycetota bacterium]
MQGMLDGIRVIDFTTTVAGPFCGFYLCEMGAEVIHLERPGLGDMARLYPPYFKGISGTFVQMNHGKKSVTIDLKNPKGLELFKELVAVSDVLVSNFSGGTMDRMGVGYEVLSKINPRLVMCEMSGYGQTGPLSQYPAYDGIIQAMTGIMATTGEEHPTRVGVLVGDIGTAMAGTIAILGSLYAREKTGMGEYIDLAMYDTLLTFLEAKFLEYSILGKDTVRTGNRYPHLAPFDSFSTKDKDVVICAANESTFGALCKAMGKPELAEDERFNNPLARLARHEELKGIIEEWTKQHTRDEVVDILMAHGTPVAPAKEVSEAISHPHTAARGMIVELEQLSPETGQMEKLKIYPIPIKTRNHVVKSYPHAPALGEHNDWLLTEVLGKSAEEAEEVKASGAMGPVSASVTQG